MGSAALIVTADAAAGAQIQKLLKASRRFAETHTVNGLQEALHDMRLLHVYELVFVSAEFPVEQVGEFLVEALRTRAGIQVAAVVFCAAREVFDSKRYGGLEIDGFLSAAASLATFEEVVDKARAAARGRSSVRARAAVKAIVTDIMQQLDQVAYLKACNQKIDDHLERLRASSGALRELDDQSLRTYFSVASETFEKALTVEITYRGASKRVRKMMEERVFAQLQQHYRKL